MSEVSLRPIEVDDFDCVFELHRRSEAFDKIPRSLEFEELEELLDDEQRILATDTRLATVDDTVAGYIHTYYLPSPVRLERCYIFGQVDPRQRNLGVGRAMMTWAMERAVEQLHSSGRVLPKFIRVDQYDFVEPAHRLFARMGFQPVRYHEQLLRPLDQLPDPIAIDGIRIMPWPIERSEEIRQVKNAAFADHWGSTPTSADHWHLMTTGHGRRLDLSFVAVDDDDAIVGHCMNSRYEADDRLLGRQEAWIDNLGTVDEHRGRGVASAMIVRSLHAFAAAGLSHASLDVDSANPTGAAQLYRRLGFDPQTRTITHEMELPPDATAIG